MIYTELTRRAMETAYEAHHGQTDRSGVPYIFHPMHLAEQMTDELTTCVALLHDVLEDTRLTAEDLERDFPEEIVSQIRLLTHDPEEDYFDYVRRVAGDPVARQIKLADLNHNSDQSRLGPEVSEADKVRWQIKYAEARKILGE